MTKVEQMADKYQARWHDDSTGDILVPDKWIEVLIYDVAERTREECLGSFGLIRPDIDAPINIIREAIRNARWEDKEA